MLMGRVDSSDFETLEDSYPGIIHSDYYEAVDEPKIIDKPESFDLAKNFPNPFNARTKIDYRIEEAGNYILEVYDMSGKLVSILADGYMGTGRYTVKWEGTNLRGNPVESGTYLYRLRDFNGNATLRKMSLVK